MGQPGRTGGVAIIDGPRRLVSLTDAEIAGLVIAVHTVGQAPFVTHARRAVGSLVDHARPEAQASIAKISPPAIGERFEGNLITDPLDQHHGPGRLRPHKSCSCCLDRRIRTTDITSQSVSSQSTPPFTIHEISVPRRADRHHAFCSRLPETTRLGTTLGLRTGMRPGPQTVERPPNDEGRPSCKRRAVTLRR